MSPSDPVGYARATLTERLDDIAALCSTERFWDADESDRIQIRSWDVRQTLDCPAKAAAEALTPFEATVRTTWRGAAVDALDALAKGASDANSAYRAAYQGADPQYWPWNWVRSDGTSDQGVANAAERALVGARAIAFVAAAARLQTWPPPGYRFTGFRPDWFYPSRALRVSGRIDVVTKVRDSEAIGVILPGGWSPHLRSLIGYEVLTANLRGMRQTSVTAMFPDVGAHRTMEIAINESLLNDGIEAAVAAVSVSAVQRRLTNVSHDRTPGDHCWRCPIADGCGPGTNWLSGPGHRRFGFPLTGAGIAID